MEPALAYLPVIIFIAAAAMMLLTTADDRRAQLRRIKTAFAQNNIARLNVNFRIRPRRAILYLILLLLASYIWTYQRAQDAIAAKLLDYNVDEVAVGSLIIPYSAFFRVNYVADAGFSRSKKRTRAAVAMRGHALTGFAVELDEESIARINKITTKKFVFAYLTDVEVLRPAIHNYMNQLVRARRIALYEIETFDNRGPYILIALGDNHRGEDASQIAAGVAEDTLAQLTQADNLTVNQVVVKVIAREPYVNDKSIKVIGRGKAGKY